MTKVQHQRAFTLIELSVVLVIIGLIVGGILVGRDLIGTSVVRAQISQIEKYHQASNTFLGKYGALPGDLSAVPAAQFGFTARGSGGQGDGNGIIEGFNNGGSGVNGGCVQGIGETGVFWVDLSTAKLIDGFFNTASETDQPGANITLTTTPNVDAYLPRSKIRTNYVYAWSGGTGIQNSANYDSNNYFGLSAVTGMEIGWSASYLDSGVGLTVSEAASIDSKVDDGLPQSGRVTAMYVNINVPWVGCSGWAAGGGNYGASSGSPDYAATTVATTGDDTTCFDNNNVLGNVQRYSVTQNRGSGLNCALSFKFQ